jgi:ribonuclease HII
MELIAGVDEAGRGPVIGPLVVAGVLFKGGKISKLQDLDIKDSKLLTPKRREELSKEIKRLAVKFEYFYIQPRTIDKVVRENKPLKKLNYLTAICMSRIIELLQPEVAIVDASDVIAERCKKQIGRVLSYSPKIICEHKADINYPVVSAASILAKVRRDRLIEKLNEKYGEFNSGYPHDKKTIKFLEKYFKEHENVPPFIRGSWYTVRKILEDH